MSLDNPSRLDLFLRGFRDNPNRRIYLYCGVGLLTILAVLFALDRFGGYKRDRDIKNARIAVNGAAKDLKDAQNAVVVDQVDVAVKTIRMQEAVNAAVLAVETTETQKLEVNRAAQNLANAVAANRPVDVSAADIEKKLDALGVK